MCNSQQHPKKEKLFKNVQALRKEETVGLRLTESFTSVPGCEVGNGSLRQKVFDVVPCNRPFIALRNFI